ncbi:xanthine dehydrogenase-like [Maniola jurtina]|uniref:xanthine dehydrogenase-like n=1 Tax=Maniola jurtina TaxID=191418 RepID=UPI001E68DF4A|nr:xanthine dehydrogenase-like [Maniola jurtina]
MDRVQFSVNGVKHSVGCEVSSDTTLLDYLRRHLELRGTKYNCLEAGCGACIVSAVKCHGEAPQGVNSCMVMITSCRDWDITTIEKVGNRLDGYHPLQSTLAERGGSQCGYCSPGMIMNMYSYLNEKPRTMREIEKAIGSNLCRCTGYRPILEAFKTFASDAPKPTDILDIEDLKICKKSGDLCTGSKCGHADWCIVPKQNQVLHIKLSDDRDWYRVGSLNEVFYLWQEKGTESYMLVNGNTGKGVYPILEYPRLIIDISGVLELKGYYMDQNLVLGGGTLLVEVLEIFKALAGYEGFSYFNVLSDHLEKVAHVAVRNLATVAGNLILKNQHSDFKSDIFLLFETVGAEVTIMTGPEQKKILTMQEFLVENMAGKIILSVLLPPLSSQNKIATFKIMPRFQNAHALVHAGFLYKIDETSTVIDSRIVYSGLSDTITRAYQTEQYLQGRELFTNETLQGALYILKKELVFVNNLLDPPIAYKQQVSLGLFYKGLLEICPPHIVNPVYWSGAIKLRDTRPVSKSLQSFETNPTLWPVNEPIPKIDGLIQCAGEAKYTDDVPSLPGEVFLEFVLAKVPLGTITKIDPSIALSEPGVVAFYSAADIPGVNSFIPAPNLYNTQNEELFCDGTVKYYDQPIGVIVAECESIAKKAAELVYVEYANVKKPVIDIKISKNDPAKYSEYLRYQATDIGTDTTKVIIADDTIYSQYPFTMETLSCVAYPTEEGMKLIAATQWMDLVQQAISRALNIDENRIDVYVRRLGGGYGYKITRSAQMIVASALVVHKLNRPCRFNSPLDVNMRSTGKRLPCSRNYEVHVNSRGEIQYVKNDQFSDNGYIFNEPLLLGSMDCYYNCYRKERWDYTGYNAFTDTASNTWVRSPGTLEAIAMAELMIERISYELNLNALQVRLENLDKERYSDLIELVETLKSRSQYEERKAVADEFNRNNRWKKRGLRFSWMRWPTNGYINLEINMSVYVDDGTVSITHGGIEMGQGINTVAIQIAAYFLKLPVDKIQVKPNDTVIAPNCICSGASVTTQNVGIGVRRCCEELLARLEPIRKQMNNPSWKDLIKEAYKQQIDLQVHNYTTQNDTQKYNVYGVTLAEVEIDVLTGEHSILRVDLIEDAGRSVNPEIDLGQIEGAFIFGLGYWTCENLKYHPDTGELLTNRTWEYWIPQALDIPEDFRVYFRRRSFSDKTILGAKATGEPATCMSIAIAFALREAISLARLESGIPTTQWFQIDGPFTVDKICVACETDSMDFKFY